MTDQTPQNPRGYYYATLPTVQNPDEWEGAYQAIGTGLTLAVITVAEVYDWPLIAAYAGSVESMPYQQTVPVVGWEVSASAALIGAVTIVGEAVRSLYEDTGTRLQNAATAVDQMSDYASWQSPDGGGDDGGE